MTCQHATPLSPQVNSCGLGLYGGRPSSGVCARCIERGENNEASASTYKPPSLTQQASSFVGSMAGWAKGGFQVADETTLAGRLAICHGCEFWDAKGFGGTGRCQRCGCSTQAKLRMATSKCPEGKW